jgi:hypothetical protein
MSDLAEQIDALLALNAKGAVSHPVPGLAVELLTKAAAALRASPAPLPVGEREALLALIREEAGKDNSPLGRSDSLAIRRIRTALGLDPHSGAALSKPGEQG